MKKITYVLMSILIMCIAIGLCACGTDGNGDETNTTEASTTKAQETTTEKTSEKDTTVDNAKVKYTVKVVDESGNPIAGAMVQLCKEACFPSKTNDQGIAEFSLPEDEYKASFLTLPEGYTYTGEETAFYFEDGSKDMTITLKSAS